MESVPPARDWWDRLFLFILKIKIIKNKIFINLKIYLLIYKNIRIIYFKNKNKRIISRNFIYQL